MEDIQKKDYRKVLTNIQIILIIFGVGLFFWGKYSEDFNRQILGIVCLGISNLIYGIRNMKQRVLFFFFTIMLFTFMYSRPLISMLRGNVWWYFEPKSIDFSMNSLFLTTIFLFVGAVIAQYTFKREKQVVSSLNNRNVVVLIVTLLLFVVSWMCSTFIDVEKLFFVRSHTYEDYYVSFTSKAPFILKGFATLLPYSICFLLACKPRKKIAFPALAIYVIGAIPTLLMGQRNVFVLRLLFALVYFIIRNGSDTRDKWLGKFEKSLIFIGTPFLLIILGAYNYIRAGSNVESKGIISLIVDFFYKQGTQFDTLSSGYENLNNLPFLDSKFYTFGGFIDSFKHGFIAQKIFGAPGLGTGNNPVKGMLSNSYAHNLAYVYRRDAYLAGNGNGGSYLLDLNADFGYLGIVIFSFILGGLLIYLVKLFNSRGLIMSSFVLCCLLELFWTPRGGATQWLQFLIKPSFWAAVLAVVMGYLVLGRFGLFPKKWITYIESRELL